MKKKEIKEQNEQNLNKTKTLSNVIGEVTWLLMRSLNHRYFFISDLEWMILQPIGLMQYRMFHSEKHPVGVAFWAFVSDEVEKRIINGIMKLSPADWKSGENLWLIDIVAPFGNTEMMLEDLSKNVFPDQTIKMIRTSKEGKPEVATYPN